MAKKIGTGLGAPFKPNRGERRSDEEQRRRYAEQGRRPSRPRAPPDTNDPFASPERRLDRRPRRNSESSIQQPLTEEEKRARDQRRKERERRHRERGELDKDGKPRKPGTSSRPRRPGGFDLIDKLDVTGLYGAGCKAIPRGHCWRRLANCIPVFHHDGPFDAANPHRNRRKDHKAPMQAFPKDSANNTIGGSGPVNKRIDMDRIYGRETEGYNDYNRATETQQIRKFSFETKDRPFVSDPYSRDDPVHGEETSGLGTSTFLEGSQASRSAMQRRESEADTSVPGNTGAGAGAGGNTGGIQRKKSLAQRLRGMSQPRRPPPHLLDDLPMPGPTSPDSPVRKGSIPGAPPPPSLIRSVGPQSAGGRLGAAQDVNPFFNDYDEAYDKKGASIRVAEAEKEGRPRQRDRAPSSPMAGLQRSVTSDGTGNMEPLPSQGLARVNTAGAAAPGGGGLLGRMKSLKRPKPPKAQG